MIEDTTAQPQHAMRPLTRLVHLQAILERGRISADNQKRGVEDEEVLALYDEMGRELAGLEERVESVMAQRVKQHPAWPWLSKVKGVGPQMAALLLAYLLPPKPEYGPSSWYKAGGLYVIQGEDGQSHLNRYSHLKDGQRADWHPRLRRNLWLAGGCLLRAQGFYYSFYTQVKDAMARKHMGDATWLPPCKPCGGTGRVEGVATLVREEETVVQGCAPCAGRGYLQGRVHAVAQWKMVKLFLAHLWEVWSKAEGLETREPYPMEILGHVKIMVPEDGG